MGADCVVEAALDIGTSWYLEVPAGASSGSIALPVRLAGLSGSGSKFN